MVLMVVALYVVLIGDGSNIESLLGSLKQEEQQEADDVNLGVAKTLQVMLFSVPSAAAGDLIATLVAM